MENDKHDKTKSNVKQISTSSYKGSKKSVNITEILESQDDSENSNHNESSEKIKPLNIEPSNEIEQEESINSFKENVLFEEKVQSYVKLIKEKQMIFDEKYKKNKDKIETPEEIKERDLRHINWARELAHIFSNKKYPKDYMPDIMIISAKPFDFQRRKKCKKN